MGQVFYKMIGKVYYNQDSDTVLLSYVGFLGHRVDVDVPRRSISFTSEKSGTIYTPLHLSESKSPHILKLPEKYYHLCNVELARKVFGQSYGRQ